MVRLPSRPKDRAAEMVGAFPEAYAGEMELSKFATTTSSLADMIAATAFSHHRHSSSLVHLTLTRFSLVDHVNVPRGNFFLLASFPERSRCTLVWPPTPHYFHSGGHDRGGERFTDQVRTVVPQLLVNTCYDEPAVDLLQSTL